MLKGVLPDFDEFHSELSKNWVIWHERVGFQTRFKSRLADEIQCHSEAPMSNCHPPNSTTINSFQWAARWRPNNSAAIVKRPKFSARTNRYRRFANAVVKMEKLPAPASHSIQFRRTFHDCFGSSKHWSTSVPVGLNCHLSRDIPCHNRPTSSRIPTVP